MRMTQVWSLWMSTYLHNMGYNLSMNFIIAWGLNGY